MVDDRPPMLQMDGIRLATLAVLAVDTLVVILLAVFLVTNVQDQRVLNECYQRHIDALTAWATTAVQAGTESRQAQRELLLSQGVVDPGQARQQYLDRLDEADRTRSTAPVPAQRCAR
jgi:hypothetical protein